MNEKEWLSSEEVRAALGIECNNVDFIRWTNNRSLWRRNIDWRTVPDDRGRQNRYQYRGTSCNLNRIFRLHYYDVLRHLDPERYTGYANKTIPLSVFSLTFSKDPFSHNPPPFLGQQEEDKEEGEDLRKIRSYVRAHAQNAAGGQDPVRLTVSSATAGVLWHLHNVSHGVFIVRYGAHVYGGDADYVAVVECADDVALAEHIGETLNLLRGLGVSATFRVKRAQTRGRPFWVTRDGNDDEVPKFLVLEGSTMRAVIIMTANGAVNPTDLEETYKLVRKVDGVLGCALVYGDCELIAIVQAETSQAMRTLVMEKLRGQAGITGTRTYITIEEFDGLYEAPDKAAAPDQETNGRPPTAE